MMKTMMIMMIMMIKDCNLNFLLLMFVSLSAPQFLINKLPALNQLLHNCQTDNKCCTCITMSTSFKQYPQK
jgi:hypothetical protein